MLRICPESLALYFIDVQAEAPFRFGGETLKRVTCARVMFEVKSSSGGVFRGWGESPLSAQWAWPGNVPLSQREEALREFCCQILDAWSGFGDSGHALELGHSFLRETLPGLLASFNSRRNTDSGMPYLAALICCAPFDIALHDAYGQAAGKPVYDCYSSADMSRDLEYHFGDPNFRGLYPADFLSRGAVRIPAWHAVGGLDELSGGERGPAELRPGIPATLEQWILKDGLNRLKIKLGGADFERDFGRFIEVADISMPLGVEMLGVDFNGMVKDPKYLEQFFERIDKDRPGLLDSLRFIEEPFAPQLLESGEDISSVAKWAPLFLDESAHDWRVLPKAKRTGYSGVAVKTCKTQTEAVLTTSWARRYGLDVLTQDLTNPMLAQISHVQLGSHACPEIGVETNSMQFYPRASAEEAVIHPGLYRRVDGSVDLSTISGPGFGYRLEEIARRLPEPARTS